MLCGAFLGVENGTDIVKGGPEQDASEIVLLVLEMR